MGYLSSVGTSIEKLVNQYHGRMYGELVLYQLKQNTPEKLLHSMSGLYSNVHPELIDTTEKFIDTNIDAFSNVADFWTMDCGESLSLCINSTKAESRKFGIEVDDDYAFDIFNLITLSLAYEACVDTEFKEKIEGFVNNISSVNNTINKEKYVASIIFYSIFIFMAFTAWVMIFTIAFENINTGTPMLDAFLKTGLTWVFPAGVAIVAWKIMYSNLNNRLEKKDSSK